MAALRVENVWKSRIRSDTSGNCARYPVLEDVSFSIDDGGAFALVGPSGSGKSTVLRLITRLEDADSGRVLIGGRPTTEMDVLALRRRVGLVGQRPVVFDGSVAENVRFGPRQTGADLDPNRVEGLLTLVGLLPDYAPREARELSVGEQQRVCIARSLANEPQVLLLDEPTSALDRESARRVIEALAGVRASLCMTLLLVTHVVEDAIGLADRAGLLHGGRLAAEGAPSELLGPMRRLSVEGSPPP